MIISRKQIIIVVLGIIISTGILAVGGVLFYQENQKAEQALSEAAQKQAEVMTKKQQHDAAFVPAAETIKQWNPSHTMAFYYTSEREDAFRLTKVTTNNPFDIWFGFQTSYDFGRSFSDSSYSITPRIWDARENKNRLIINQFAESTISAFHVIGWVDDFTLLAETTTGPSEGGQVIFYTFNIEKLSMTKIASSTQGGGFDENDSDENLFVETRWGNTVFYQGCRGDLTKCTDIKIFFNVPEDDYSFYTSIGTLKPNFSVPAFNRYMNMLNLNDSFNISHFNKKLKIEMEKYQDSEFVPAGYFIWDLEQGKVVENTIN